MRGIAEKNGTFLEAIPSIDERGNTREERFGGKATKKRSKRN